jgi:pyruvate dehydrogenase E1 component
MASQDLTGQHDPDPIETSEWIESLEAVISGESKQRAKFLLEHLVNYASQKGVFLNQVITTPYLNTIPKEEQPPYPGDLEVERRIRALIRWNAVAMVVRANKKYPNIGGHLSTYASAASLFEVGFNHFFKGPDHPQGADHIFFQGHASPGIYARAFLEGRLKEEQLDHFRREVDKKGLSSYPHPWLMPNFWQFSTVSMGLGPLLAAHQAYFDKYLHNRAIVDTSNVKTWCFTGDGELDEPESSSAIALAGRESLDNLIFVVNCNLQRLDGPVRGNGKIIQELEARFKGSGWNVIKVIWGSKWDELLQRDTDGLLVKRMEQALDGDYQKYAASSGSFIREHFFGTHPKLKELVADYSDEELATLPRGGHDVIKLYAAYYKAVNHKGQPTAILAKTVKGWHLGPKIEARNATHAAKTMGKEELIEFRDRIKLQDLIKDDDLKDGIPPIVRPKNTSKEITYLLERRKALGGFLPSRKSTFLNISPPDFKVFSEFYEGSSNLEVSTTNVLARILRNLVRDKNIKDRVVPIVADEARSFGLEPLFSEIKIYSPKGQLYTPVDAELLLSYKESEHGQMLEEGISEADAMASFVAAGTSYSTWGQPIIPFYLFYSMFGFQRVGDLIWAASDMRSRGFLIGTTAGRTAYNGEGLQHQDGHSHLVAMTVPTVKAYDPAFAYELAAIIEYGIKEMLDKDSGDFIYYITTYNENYRMPPAQGSLEELKEKILKGLYLFQDEPGAEVALIFSGPLNQYVMAAKEILQSQWAIKCQLWSLTSVKALREDAMEIERKKRYLMDHKESYFTQCLEQMPEKLVFVSDFMSATFDLLTRFIPKHKKIVSLGTEGFGRSDTRAKLREFFEIDERYIALATISLYDDSDMLKKAIETLGVSPDPTPYWKK